MGWDGGGGEWALNKESDNKDMNIKKVGIE